jgi:MFS family permease
MFATTVGPAFGPLWGSVIITFTSWRVMFWLQAGLAGLSAILVILFLPETIHHKLLDDIRDKPSSERTRQVLHQLNPLKIVKMIRYPNLLLTVRVSQGI